MKEKLKIHALKLKAPDKSGNLEDLLAQIKSDHLSVRSGQFAGDDVAHN